MNFLSNAFLATIICFACIIVATTEGTIVQQQAIDPATEVAVVNVQEQQSMRPGGYSPVDMSEPNPRLLEAANYVIMQNLPEKYSFTSSIVQDRTTTSSSNNYSFHVVKAFQQVVAGMNYKMIIRITNNTNKDNNNHSCIGAFAVTVYDQFGTLSVTTWGKEISCSDVETIRLEKNQQLKLLHSIPLDSYFNE